MCGVCVVVAYIVFPFFRALFLVLSIHSFGEHFIFVLHSGVFFNDCAFALCMHRICSAAAAHTHTHSRHA